MEYVGVIAIWIFSTKEYILFLYPIITINLFHTPSQKHSTMNQVMNTQLFNKRPAPRPSISLGNNQPRYNSYVDGMRSKYQMNSTRNSQQTPQWMNRTQYFHRRTTKPQYQVIGKDSSMGSGTYEDKQGFFKTVRQTYIYENKAKYPDNTSGQFLSIPKKKARSLWEMKNHTYELEWPKEQRKKKSFINSRTSSVNNRSYILENNPEHNMSVTTRDFKYHLPKYGIRQSPLHVQRDTPLKIGHSAVIDTYRIK